MIKKISIFLLLATAISLLLVDINQDQFSSERWADNPLERYRMINDLLESSRLKDLTKGQVIKLLGRPNAKYLGATEHLAYRLGTPPSFMETKPNGLLITFKDGKTDKITLYDIKE